MERVRLAIIGIGNTLAGDDGVGPEVVRRLRLRLGKRDDVLLHSIDGDMLEIADWLDRAERLVLVDAVTGDEPGRIVVGEPVERAWAPSFHQADIATTMRSLAALGLVDSFPAWEVWGVTILPPQELGEGLSPEVERAAAELVDRLLEECSSAATASRS
jgi:hydrogenase maturation protease